MAAAAAAFNAPGRRVLADITRNKEGKESTSKNTNSHAFLAGASSSSSFYNNKKMTRGTNFVTQKDMAEKIKYSSKAEIGTVLQKILIQNPQLRSFLKYHPINPSNNSNIVRPSVPTTSPPPPSSSPTPTALSADHPIYNRCFHCKATDNNDSSRGENNKLYRFFGVRICTRCDCIMEFFQSTKIEADKIRRIRRWDNGLSYYTYQAEDVIKTVKKQYGSLVQFRLQQQQQQKHHSNSNDFRLPTDANTKPSNTKENSGNTYKLLLSAKTEGEKREIIHNAIRCSGKEDLDALLKSITREHLTRQDVQEIVSDFHPRSMPAKPSSPNDPLLQRCFLCKDANRNKSSEGSASSSSLHNFYDIKACTQCMVVVGGCLSREQVMEIFHFTRFEAEKIKHKTVAQQESSGRKRVVTTRTSQQIHNPNLVVAAAKKKWGTLYNMLSQNKSP